MPNCGKWNAIVYNIKAMQEREQMKITAELRKIELVF